MKTVQRIKVKKNTGILSAGYSVIDAECEAGAKPENRINEVVLFSGSLIECDIWLKFYWNSMLI